MRRKESNQTKKQLLNTNVVIMVLQFIIRTNKIQIRPVGNALLLYGPWRWEHTWDEIFIETIIKMQGPSFSHHCKINQHNQ